MYTENPLEYTQHRKGIYQVAQQRQRHLHSIKTQAAHKPSYIMGCIGHTGTQYIIQYDWKEDEWEIIKFY